MDATQRFRERVHGLLVRGLSSARVAEILGIRGVSEVWGGAVPLDRPAWYVWLHGAPGAYRLQLREAVADAEGAALARFALGYYPAPTEAAFRCFSTEERAFVQSDVFDETVTPRAERAHEVPDDLFGVGFLEHVVEAAGGEEVALVTMDRLRVRYEEDAAIHYAPLGADVVHRRGEVARDVPGWRLAAPLFRVFAGLLAHTDRRAPRAIGVSSDEGTEHVFRGGRFECVPARDLVLGEAEARFGGDARSAGAPAADVPSLPLLLGASWWSLADVPESARAACGCCG